MEKNKKNNTIKKESKEITDWKQKAELISAKAEEYLDGWKRAKADFINYKNRQDEVMADFRKYAKEGFILEILPVLDSFSEALKHIPGRDKDLNWAKGIVQIKNQLEEILKNNGLEEIKTTGEKFNPEFHEAVEMVESDKQSGIIIDEAQKGYTLNGKVIRAAKVRVAK